ncbi:hypothetical protein C8R45DRAFT_239006 [Mycena sanguinolenta]|nr:hypothetical protein C8R45DRAFT_239006 [Mycena sanguinolenta]
MISYLAHFLFLSLSSSFVSPTYFVFCFIGHDMGTASENQNNQHPVTTSKSHILESHSVFAHRPHDATRHTALQPMNGLADAALKHKPPPETKKDLSRTSSLTVRTTPAPLIQSTLNFSKTPNICAVAPDAQKLKTTDASVTPTPIHVSRREEDAHDVPPIAVLPEITSPDVEIVPAPLPSPRVVVPLPVVAKPNGVSKLQNVPFAKPSARAPSSRSTPDSFIPSASANTRGHRDSFVSTPVRASTRRRSADLDTDADTDLELPFPKHARIHAALYSPVRARRAPDLGNELGLGHAERYVRAPMRELDVLREFTPARVGKLGQAGGDWPELGLESAAAWAERERAAPLLLPKTEKLEGTEGASMDGNEGAGANLNTGAATGTRTGTGNDQDEGFGARGEGRGGWPWGSRMYGQPNTAPTEAYAVLLVETFGPGSMLRGEGPKPRPVSFDQARGGKKSKAGAGKRSASEASSVAVSVSDAMDVDGEAGEGEEGAPSRVGEWIAEIQVAVKGKKQLTREGLEALANTLWAIADMSEEEGLALGDNGPLLKESLMQLAQLEDIPFGDEHRVRQTARKMVKCWPK